MKKTLKLLLPAIAAVLTVLLAAGLIFASPFKNLYENGTDTVTKDTQADESQISPDTTDYPDTSISDETAADTSLPVDTTPAETSVPDTTGEDITIPPESTGDPSQTQVPDTDIPAVTTSSPVVTTEPEPVTEPVTEPLIIPVEKIEIVTPSESLSVGQFMTLTANVYPEDATNKSITWGISCSSNTAIINAWGKLTARATGTITVFALANDGSGVRGSVKIQLIGDQIRIGVIFGGANTENVKNMISSVGAIPVDLPLITSPEQADAVIAQIDGIVFTGGQDIDPAYYGETVLNSSVIFNNAKDYSDITLMKTALKANLPMLCICRGMQILNVVCGGSLYQDLPSQITSPISHRDPARAAYTFHLINIDKSSRLYKDILKYESVTINSWHHQAVKDVGQGLRVTATAADGVVEAIELESNPYVIGVQFHPEYTLYELFDNLKNDAKSFKNNNRQLPKAG